MLTMHKMSDNNLKFTHLKHGLTDLPELEDFDLDKINIFELGKDEKTFFQNMLNVQTIAARLMYDDPVVKELYNRREEFDLVIIDSMYNDVSNIIDMNSKEGSIVPDNN